MLKKSIILLALTCAIMGLFLFHSGAQDQEEYRTLLKSSKSAAAHSPFGMRQERTGVHKQIFLTKDSFRHEIVIQSPKSELVLTSGSEMVENLNDVSCWMQERLWVDDNKKPMQEVRQLKSRKATLSYQDHLFRGEDVSLSHYTCQGHCLTYNPRSQTLLMKGKAKEAHFSLGEELQFNAHHLKASFYPSS